MTGKTNNWHKIDQVLAFSVNLIKKTTNFFKKSEFEAKFKKGIRPGL